MLKTYFIECIKGNDMQYFDCKNYVAGIKDFISIVRGNFYSYVRLCSSDGRILKEYRKVVR